MTHNDSTGPFLVPPIAMNRKNLVEFFQTGPSSSIEGLTNQEIVNNMISDERSRTQLKNDEASLEKEGKRRGILSNSNYTPNYMVVIITIIISIVICIFIAGLGSLFFLPTAFIILLCIGIISIGVVICYYSYYIISSVDVDGGGLIDTSRIGKYDLSSGSGKRMFLGNCVGASCCNDASGTVWDANKSACVPKSVANVVATGSTTQSIAVTQSVSGGQSGNSNTYQSGNGVTVGSGTNNPSGGATIYNPPNRVSLFDPTSVLSGLSSNPSPNKGATDSVTPKASGTPVSKTDGSNSGPAPSPAANSGPSSNSGGFYDYTGSTISSGSGSITGGSSSTVVGYGSGSGSGSYSVGSGSGSYSVGSGSSSYSVGSGSGSYSVGSGSGSYSVGSGSVGSLGSTPGSYSVGSGSGSYSVGSGSVGSGSVGSTPGSGSGSGYSVTIKSISLSKRVDDVNNTDVKVSLITNIPLNNTYNILWIFNDTKQSGGDMKLNNMFYSDLNNTLTLSFPSINTNFNTLPTNNTVKLKVTMGTTIITSNAFTFLFNPT